MLGQGLLNRGYHWTNSSLRQAKDDAAEKALYWLGRSAMDRYMQAMLQLDIVRRAPLPEGPKILAANHPTTTDPFFLLALVPEQVSILVTDKAFEVPVFGSYLRRAGHMPVVRNSGGATIAEAARLLEAGRTIGIFPEGALSPLAGELSYHEAHSGVARLALSTGTPVIPVGISLDPGRIWFREMEFESGPEMARYYLRGPYVVTLGEPMVLEGDVRDWERVRSLSHGVMQRIVCLSRESEERLRARQVPERRTPLVPMPFARSAKVR